MFLSKLADTLKNTLQKKDLPMSAVDGGNGGEKKATPEMVNVTIDGKALQVEKGTNLIDAAAQAGVEIPHYCYHPHLSVAGNCRMCQVAVQGQPKLQIACNMTASEGLVVQTQLSNAEVADAQRATLEFLLINHPLDCTVCDQAGHCKLQDYHYQYNAKGSRFVEDKVNKVKAEPLGPNVVYDGERCIMCTRCVRFCDEVPETSELGAFNRGDRGVIGVFPGKELNNPLSGTVVDLCPVGALTHRQWRFNNRYWYAKETESICTGCSTGCNVKVAVRDDQIVQVKSRLNSQVNKEWLCDEGRYGFLRFQPASRLTAPQMRKGEAFAKVSPKEAYEEAAKLKSGSESDTLIFLSPLLSLEEVLLAFEFSEKVIGLPAGSASLAMQIRQRELTSVQAKLISPDYSANARAFSLLVGDPGESSWRSSLENRYQSNLKKLASGSVKKVLLVGDLAIHPDHLDEAISKGIHAAEVSVAITATDVHSREAGSQSLASDNCKVLLPGRSVNEKSGVMVNKDMRLQKFKALLTPPVGSLPDWMLLQKVAEVAGKKIVDSAVIDDRELFRNMIAKVPDLKSVTLAKIGPLGISLAEVLAGDRKDQQSSTAGAAGTPA